MKKIIGLALVSCLLFAYTAVAEDNNGAGCGLGKIVMDGKKGMGAHLGAVALNFIINSFVLPTHQTSAMTSGTSGCDTDQVILREKEQEVFVAVNMGNLSQEMARGDGEYLHSLAGLMGCSTAVYSDFATLTQDKFAVLFNGDATSTSHLLTGLKREMLADPKLASSCSRLT